MSGIRERKRCGSVQDVSPLIGISRKRSHKDFYVYVWLDPRKPGKFVYEAYSFDYEPIYVGKGNTKRNRAFLFRRRNCILTNKIKKINAPIVLFYEKNLNECEAFQREINMIQTIGRIDKRTGPLCNCTDGGEGISGFIFTKEMRQKLSDSHIGYKVLEETKIKISSSMTGKEKSEQTRVKFSAAAKARDHTNLIKSLTGRVPSEETRMLWSQQRKGRKQSKETIEKRTAKLRGIPRPEYVKLKISATKQRKKREKTKCTS